MICDADLGGKSEHGKIQRDQKLEFVAENLELFDSYHDKATSGETRQLATEEAAKKPHKAQSFRPN